MADGGGKLHITTSAHSREELATILRDYTTVKLESSQQLFGGYSASTYRLQLADDSLVVLKVCNGYTPSDAESMCRTVAYLERKGFHQCCFPIPRLGGGDHQFTSLKERDKVPSFLLNYVEGSPADVVMRNNAKLAVTVMRGIGAGLGKMHDVASGITLKELQKESIRYYETDGGCCDVEDHFRGTIRKKILNSTVRDHPFVLFYEDELLALIEGMKLVKEGKLSLGITHGDPFSDNVLSFPDDGQLSAFIDIEDICIGPLLFDLACCAIGCCFVSLGVNNQQLDFDLLSALFQGYTSARTLPELERCQFVAFMRLTLLCNCCWRFVKFNVSPATEDESIPARAKDSHLELQRRIEYLHDDNVVKKINSLLNKCSVND